MDASKAGEKIIAEEAFYEALLGRISPSGFEHGDVAEIARQAGVHRNTVGRWKSRENKPGLYSVLRLALARGESPGVLGFGEHALSPEDAETLRAFNGMDEAKRNAALAAAYAISGKPPMPAFRPVVDSKTPVNKREDLQAFKLVRGKGKAAVPIWMNLAAGPGGFLERCPEVWVIPKLAMARGIHTAIIRGDSMLETLQPGDVAILQELNNGQGTVLPAKESQDDKMPLQMWERQIPGNRIFALSLDGGQTLTIKRIRYQGKGADWYMLIEADNPAEFDARVVSSKDEVIVYAMLIGLGEK